MLRRLAPLLIAVLLAFSACGDDSPSSQRLDVSAATSLKMPLSVAAADFKGANVRLSFAGSDQLAARIRAGARPDVFAAANTKLPAALASEKLVETPVEFATNTLVVAVPSDGSKVASVRDLAKPGVKLAVGAPAVPVGDYTQKVLGRLDEPTRRRILANVRSSEPDVAGIVGKLTQGAVDAGLVYTTDVRATNGRLRAIPLPAALRPQVVYGAAVVRGAKNPAAARRYVRELVSGSAAKALTAAGFGPSP